MNDINYFSIFHKNDSLDAARRTWSDGAMTIGGRIVEARKSAGLTQPALAEALEKTQQTISHWERGRATPSIAELARIGEALRVEAVWLAFGIGTPTGNSALDEHAISIAATTLYEYLAEHRLTVDGPGFGRMVASLAADLVSRPTAERVDRARDLASFITRYHRQP